jgi:putative transposase
VRVHRAVWPTRTQCRVLGVSTSGFYAWCQREPSPRAIADDELAGILLGLYAFSDDTYGRPRLHAGLRDLGVSVSRGRVRRLMHEYGLVGAHRRRGWVTTTQRDRNARPAPDLVERNFHPEAPNRLWVADITYIPTWAGFLYLSVVIDAFSRRVIGWSMATDLGKQLVIDALDMAIHQRKPAGVIHHSDQGSQYTSLAFGLRCKEAGVRASMGTVADCYDNAMCESFFATLECELLARRRFKTQVEARMAVFRYIESWYNPHRTHSALGYRSPIAFEQDYAA